MNIHTQLCTVAHRSMWYFHELKIALLPSYMIKKNLKNKYIKIRRKIENNTRRYILKLFFFKLDKEIESKKKKKMIELNFKRF